jgi:hypothetical protein
MPYRSQAVGTYACEQLAVANPCTLGRRQMISRRHYELTCNGSQGQRSGR